jgi:hypothetical protein
MTDFEFLFALFSLLFGLIVAELSIKFADAIDSSRERPVGILTPALAFLLLTDATTFWLCSTSSRPRSSFHGPAATWRVSTITIGRVRGLLRL